MMFKWLKSQKPQEDLPTSFRSFQSYSGDWNVYTEIKLDDADDAPKTEINIHDRAKTKAEAYEACLAKQKHVLSLLYSEGPAVKFLKSLREVTPDVSIREAIDTFLETNDDK